MSDSSPEPHDEDYKCVIKAQEWVRKGLDELFYNFQQSENYFRWTSDQKRRLIFTDDQKQDHSLFTLYGVHEIPSKLVNILRIGLDQSAAKTLGLSDFKSEAQDIDPTFEQFMDDCESKEAFETPEEESGIFIPGEFLASTSKLARVKQDIQTVTYQMNCLRILALKLQTTADTSLMKRLILDKTKEALSDEIANLTSMKSKFESIERKEAIVPGQCHINIESEENIDENITYYLITITKNSHKSGWTVRRRYSDFDLLHRKLKANYPIVSEFELPGKTIGIWNPRVRAEARSGRTKALEKYLQRLVDTSKTSESLEVHNFLSSNYILKSYDGAIRRTQKKLALKISQFRRKRSPQKNGIIRPDGEKNRNLVWMRKAPQSPAEETQSSAFMPIHNNHEYLSSDSQDSSDEDFLSVSSEESYLVTKLQQNNTYTLLDDDLAHSTSESLIITGICDIMIAVFDFRVKAQYLKRNLGKMLLAKLCGYEVEGYFANILRQAVKNENLANAVSYLSERNPFPEWLVEAEVSAKKSYELKKKLATVLTPSFSGIIGKQSSQAGIVAVYELLQSQTLLKHLIYSLIDSFQN
jgi:sorting nexin-25